VTTGWGRAVEAAGRAVVAGCAGGLWWQAVAVTAALLTGAPVDVVPQLRCAGKRRGDRAAP
jgi:hypothetical protein